MDFRPKMNSESWRLGISMNKINSVTKQNLKLNKLEDVALQKEGQRKRQQKY